MSDEAVTTAEEKAPAIVLPPVTADTVNEYVGKYVQLRDKINAIKEVHKKQLAPYTNMLEALNGLLLNFLNTAGVDSVAVKGQGTFYKTSRTTTSIVDGDAFRRHVIGMQDFDLIDWRANANAVKAFMDNNQGELPPGVNLNVMYVAGVRKN